MHFGMWVDHVSDNYFFFGRGNLGHSVKIYTLSNDTLTLLALEVTHVLVGELLDSTSSLPHHQPVLPQESPAEAGRKIPGPSPPFFPFRAIHSGGRHSILHQL